MSYHFEQPMKSTVIGRTQSKDAADAAIVYMRRRYPPSHNFLWQWQASGKGFYEIRHVGNCSASFMDGLVTVCCAYVAGAEDIRK